MEGRRKCYYRRPFARISRSDQLAGAISGSTNGEEVEAKVERKDEPVPLKEPTSDDKRSGTEEEGPKRQVAAPSVIDAGPPLELLCDASVIFPKLTGSSISVMRFNKCYKVDPSKWKSLKMAREDKSKIQQTFIDKTDMPKFGGGSEYGREANEEARRREYESKKKYKLEDQPWVMKTSNNEIFRGMKEGGVTDNAAYFILEKTNADTFEAFPVSDWYRFTPMERYRALNSEQAEEQFDRRNKIYNFFSVMIKNRIKAEDEDQNSKSDKSESASGKISKRGNTGLKVSEMDDWDDSDVDEDDSDNEGAKPKKPNGRKRKAKSNPDEDSDDGDGEGREVDYITDTSESESEEEQQKKMRVGGVEEEKGLRNLLDSGTDEEEEKEPGEKEDENSQAF